MGDLTATFVATVALVVSCFVLALLLVSNGEQGALLASAMSRPPERVADVVHSQRAALTELLNSSEPSLAAFQAIASGITTTCNGIPGLSDARVTWVSAEGSVRFDTQAGFVATEAKLWGEDAATEADTSYVSRPSIATAMQAGTGFVTRWSGSSLHDRLYVAVALTRIVNDGFRHKHLYGVMRVSCDF